MSAVIYILAFAIPFFGYRRASLRSVGGVSLPQMAVCIATVFSLFGTVAPTFVKRWAGEAPGELAQIVRRQLYALIDLPANEEENPQNLIYLL